MYRVGQKTRTFSIYHDDASVYDKITWISFSFLSLREERLAFSLNATVNIIFANYLNVY